MLTVTFPANLNLLFTGLISAATFDIVPFIEEITEYLWDFEHSADEFDNPGFNSIGFETNNFIINSGSLFIIFLIFLAQLLLIKVLKYYAKHDESWIPLYRRFKF
jgi:hypothetical protein